MTPAGILPCRTAGEVLPTTALDNLVSQGGNVLVDIRPAQEKEAVGVPDLPDQGRRAASEASVSCSVEAPCPMLPAQEEGCCCVGDGLRSQLPVSATTGAFKAVDPLPRRRCV